MLVQGFLRDEFTVLRRSSILLMNLPESMRIFLESKHIFVLATALQGVPHACSLFYVLNAADGSLVFSSSESTLHARQMRSNPQVAGAVFADTRAVNEIHGVQFSGNVLPGVAHEARAAYLTAFPEAEKIKSPFWTLKLAAVKMIDNRLGFGHKELWHR